MEQQTPEALPTRYDPFAVEDRWARRWVAEPFTADPDSGREPFCIVIPPPNVTGNLHLGHAFPNTIIDALVRFKRMQGFEALFQPGTDHAGISTQVQVERALASEGLTRHQLGREAFLERVWAWKERYGGIILGQLQRLGISADWSRTRFTMDQGLSRAVRRQFVELFHKGLIYRGERIVNWDPASQTTLSDLEVEREERPGRLYTLAYPLEGGDGDLRIATVRPETIFADQAVAVHPEDVRYRTLVGRRVRIPLTERLVPVIADEAVERDFGTGALKITPAHDPTDFEIGERHGLGHPSVISLDARLDGELVPERFRGKERFEARAAVVAALREEGTLVAEADYTIPIGISQRTHEPVEPILSLQWFYDVRPVAQRVLAALDAGDLRVVPERYAKVNRDWLEAIRPWNISRQLWWGHQIPAWYDGDGNVYVPDAEDPYTDPPERPENAGKDLRQDPDVFDTWFSSSLWPFSTLGWPDEDDAFYRTFYPNQVLVTGYDILFFWVARMEMAGLELTGRAPFKDVLLHGLVLDAQGQKMSKSKGNGVDPLEVIDRYGADALRFAVTHASTGGQDIRWDDRRVEMGRNFDNKLWNAARFSLVQLGEGPEDPGPALRLADRWILSRLQRAVEGTTAALEAYDLGAANRLLYDFVWSEFCDWYLEAAKPALRAGDARTRAVLRKVLEAILALLHPLIPFITSELYQALGHECELGRSGWPVADPELIDGAAERDFGTLRAAVGAVRALRADAELPPTRVVPVHLSGEAAPRVRAERVVAETLARASFREGRVTGPALTQVAPGLELCLSFEGLVDEAEWVARQRKRLAKLEADRERSERKLANDKFTANAPEEVVTEERRRLVEAEELIGRVETALAQLDAGA